MGNLSRASVALIESLRDFKRYQLRGGALNQILRRYARCRVVFWSIMTGSDIDPNATIGSGLSLPHPTGVVVHRDAVIGDNCMIMQQVTIGQLAENFAPRIGSSVYIGAGAKVLGKIVIGDRARIGANAVVLCDVPPDHVAVGVPARVSPQACAEGPDENSVAAFVNK